MTDPSVRIRQRLSEGLFGNPLIDNALRGPFTEYMCAEALGPSCTIVSGGWHAWDLELGSSTAAKLRLQVKNTARTQTWHINSRKLSNCQWNLTLRNRPSYFEEYNPGVECEEYGFLCDAFILCHHPISEWAVADHRNVHQWDFYVVPVTPTHELFPVVLPDQSNRKPKTYNVVPETLRTGIRGRSPVEPVKFDALTEAYIRAQMLRAEFLSAR